MSHYENYILHDKDQPNFTKLLKGLITPRPIAFVTTVNQGGLVNAAPFSFFNLVSIKPSLVSICFGRREGAPKDTLRNILENKEFIVNLCPSHFADTLNLAAQDCPSHISEVELAKLSLMPSSSVTPPRIVGTLAQLECRLFKIVEIEDEGGGNEVVTDMVIGKVVNLHIAKEALDEKGYLNKQAFHPIARCIGDSYWHQRYPMSDGHA